MALGAILTGGRSTRMGQDKSDVLVGEHTMLDRVGSALVSARADPVVVLGPDRAGWESWPDSVHAEGPLAGIATGLSRTDRPHVMVVAVDQPFCMPATLAKLIAMAVDLPVVPVDHDGVRQVTCAVYPMSLAGAAIDEARNGGSIQSLLDRASFRPVTPDEWEAWGEDGRSWYSVDDPDRLEEGLSRFGP